MLSVRFYNSVHLQREAQWKNIIEERNIEVSRIRSLYSNLEDENDTLTKRCKRLEEKNEEVMKAYNSKGLLSYHLT